MTEQTLQDWVANYQDHFVPERSAGMEVRVQFILSGNEPGEWYVTIRDQHADFCTGKVARPNVTITTDSQVMLDIFNGKLNGSMAFLQGKLKVGGDIPLSIKLLSTFKP